MKGRDRPIGNDKRISECVREESRREEEKGEKRQEERRRRREERELPNKELPGNVPQRRGETGST